MTVDAFLDSPCSHISPHQDAQGDREEANTISTNIQFVVPKG